ncbi:hypothetical protein L6164_003115 [Bauhinia variegata]|uniref:Uncharacterized protein n=1 Tax=Bauhinia variegata TaxID=167791 RepID=A0ACB9Q0G7_BAUVA|nr:hypothetical protein L6164_003115 [Bauhinia variegata]
MDFVSLLVDKLLERTLKPVARQVGYVISYKKNIAELAERAKELQLAREKVQHRIDAAKNNAEEIEGEVQKWLTDVDEIAQKVNKVVEDEPLNNTGCSSTNLWWRHQLSRKAKKLAQEIDEKGKKKFDEVSYHGELKITEKGASSTTSAEAFESRVLAVNQIMDALVDPNLKKIGVYGLGGVGKTTLVYEVAKKAKEKSSDLESKPLRADRLLKRLEEEKNILLILDDLWEKLDLDEIGIPHEKENKHCKILMTSRNRDVLSNQMNTQKNFQLQVLTREEAWKLFKEKAVLSESPKTDELLSVARDIIAMCDGLPIAIVTIAAALKGKVEAERRDVLRRLQNHLYSDINGPVEVSYKYLKDYRLETIFTVAGGTRPFHQWAVGHQQSAASLDELEDLNHLNSLSMVVDRDRIFPESDDIRKALTLNLKIGTNDSKHYFRGLLDHVEALRLGNFNEGSFSKLKVVRLHGCHEIKRLFSFNLPSSLPQLNQIDVRNCNLLERIVSNDGKVVGVLQFPELRSLYIHGTESLIGFYCEEIVASEVEQNKIQFADDKNQIALFSDNDKLKYLFPSFVAKALVKLQELTIRDCSELENLVGIIRKEEEDVAISRCPEMKIISKRVPSTPKLHNVKDYRASYWEGDLNSTLQKMCMYKLSHLVISEYPELKDVWHSRVDKRKFWNVDTLTISHCEWFSKAIQEKALEHLKYLQQLELKSCDSVEVVFDLEEATYRARDFVPFSELGKLILTSLSNLKHIWNKDPHRLYSFKKLVVINVSYCRCLKFIFPISFAKDLMQLEELRIENCNKLEIIVEREGEKIANKVVGTTDEIIFNKLKITKLENLPCLESFCSGNYVFTFPSLENVVIVLCPKMRKFSEGVSNTLMLENVQTDKEDESCWEGNLNSTVLKLYNNRVASGSDNPLPHVDTKGENTS